MALRDSSTFPSAPTSSARASLVPIFSPSWWITSAWKLNKNNAFKFTVQERVLHLSHIMLNVNTNYQDLYSMLPSVSMMLRQYLSICFFTQFFLGLLQPPLRELCTSVTVSDETLKVFHGLFIDKEGWDVPLSFFIQKLQYFSKVFQYKCGKGNFNMNIKDSQYSPQTCLLNCVKDSLTLFPGLLHL